MVQNTNNKASPTKNTIVPYFTISWVIGSDMLSYVKWKNNSTATRKTIAAIVMILKLSLAANDFWYANSYSYSKFGSSTIKKQ